MKLTKKSLIGFVEYISHIYLHRTITESQTTKRANCRGTKRKSREVSKGTARITSSHRIKFQTGPPQSKRRVYPHRIGDHFQQKRRRSGKSKASLRMSQNWRRIYVRFKLVLIFSCYTAASGNYLRNRRSNACFIGNQCFACSLVGFLITCNCVKMHSASL